MSVRRFVAYFFTLMICCVTLFPRFVPADTASLPTRLACVQGLSRAVPGRQHRTETQKKRYFHRSYAVVKAAST